MSVETNNSNALMIARRDFQLMETSSLSPFPSLCKKMVMLSSILISLFTAAVVLIFYTLIVLPRNYQIPITPYLPSIL